MQFTAPAEISSRVHETTFRNVYQHIVDDGELTSPRGQLVLEVENASFVLPPFVRFTNFECRKFNLNYLKKEFLWYLRGDRFDTSIANHAKMWKDLINPDGSIDSNYGQYIFTGGQFDYVVDVLGKDKDSRRASMVILQPSHLLEGSKDVPCTYSLGFRIRANYLNMTVRMRSQDAIFGMSNDIPSFSFVHEMVLNALRREHPTLEYGEYYHSADSLHVYSKHFKMLDQLTTGNSPYSLVECPLISGPNEVTYMRAGEFSEIPGEYQFTRWLNEAVTE